VSAGLDDIGAIETALVDAKGLVLVQPGYISAQLTPNVVPGDELRRGRAIFDLAAAMRLPHIVYSSSISADRPDTSAMLQPKHALERYLRELDLPATILRPVGFMENHAGPGRGLASNGTMTTAAPSDVPEQLIAIRDIGRFVSVVFDDPAPYRGVDLDIAGDELTSPEIAAAISRATGRDITLRQLSLDVVSEEHPERAAALASLYGPDRVVADLDACRALISDLMTFDQWLASPDADGLRQYLHCNR